MSFYDEIELEDFTFDSVNNIYTFPCPCGDRFEISLEDLKNGEDVARCPSCSLIVRVIFDEDMFVETEDTEQVEAPVVVVA
ncbi:diphthamide biosynthesis protein Dph3 [Schizosaccharomyces japonicus yFS275]|uniref:Diphthamide biosynthesis protein 3 n=1 Tax=Schizosaccharomyces japonicus (strain yFS275 / FY16936) TaxID=402676 RepID=B6JXV5_SCHJY|nr:diphthamide biosynthesis protein Dph3 [Schizosaccharomyces japonicus yFS275]EEB06373.1 diphthamide biosynthesis protein Dph3 [Schizosaccharomyces japonicus yFS275]